VAYAVAVIPLYAILATLNIVILAAIHANLEPGSRSSIFRESGPPFLPVEMASGVLAAVAVLVWGQAGLAAVAALVLLLAVTIPLRRTFADALHSGDDLVVLRQESDEHAAEVARLASDRERLLRRCSRPRSANARGSPKACTTGRCSDSSRSAKTLPTQSP
jgi:hypothetical protein